MIEHPDYHRSSDGFYSYTSRGQKCWGYEKGYKGERLTKQGFKTRKEANAHRATRMNLIDARYGNATRLTVEELSTEYLEDAKRKGKRRTAEGYERDLQNHILPLLGPMTLDELRPAHIQEVVRALGKKTYKRGAKGEERKLTNRTINKAMAPLRAMLSYATRMGYIPYDPAQAIKRLPEHPKERRFLSSEEACKLLDETKGQTHAVIAMLMGSGMRRGEMFGLRWEDLDLEDSIAMVRRTIDNQGREDTPKDHQTRGVVLPEWLRLILIDWWRACRSPKKGWVFKNTKGKPLDAWYFWHKIFNPARQAAGIPDITSYGLRHSYATILLSAGAIPHMVSEQLGHANSSTTHKFYSHYIKDYERTKRELDKLWESSLKPHWKDSGN